MLSIFSMHPQDILGKCSCFTCTYRMFLWKCKRRHVFPISLCSVVLISFHVSPKKRIFKTFFFQTKRETVIGMQWTEHKPSLFAQQVFWMLSRQIRTRLIRFGRTADHPLQLSTDFKSSALGLWSGSDTFQLLMDTEEQFWKHPSAFTSAHVSWQVRSGQTVTNLGWTRCRRGPCLSRGGSDRSGSGLTFLHGSKLRCVCVCPRSNKYANKHLSVRCGREILVARRDRSRTLVWMSSVLNHTLTIWHSTLGLARHRSYLICQNVAR